MRPPSAGGGARCYRYAGAAAFWTLGAIRANFCSATVEKRKYEDETRHPSTDGTNGGPGGNGGNWGKIGENIARRAGCTNVLSITAICDMWVATRLVNSPVSLAAARPVSAVVGPDARPSSSGGVALTSSCTPGRATVQSADMENDSPWPSINRALVVTDPSVRGGVHVPLRSVQERGVRWPAGRLYRQQRCVDEPTLLLVALAPGGGDAVVAESWAGLDVAAALTNAIDRCGTCGCRGGAAALGPVSSPAFSTVAERALPQPGWGDTYCGVTRVFDMRKSSCTCNVPTVSLRLAVLNRFYECFGQKTAGFVPI